LVRHFIAQHPHAVVNIGHNLVSHRTDIRSETDVFLFCLPNKHLFYNKKAGAAAHRNMPPLPLFKFSFHIRKVFLSFRKFRFVTKRGALQMSAPLLIGNQ